MKTRETFSYHSGDREGLQRWQKAWSAEFDRIDMEPAGVMAAIYFPTILRMIGGVCQ